MEVLERTPTTNRVTLRLPHQVLEVLKKEAEKRDLPLNALVTKILYKNISFELHTKAMPSITMQHDLFMKVIDKVDEAHMEEIAKEGPNIIRKLFKILGLEYNLDHVVYSYFDVVGKYCGWYDFTYEIKRDKYRLIFNTQLNSKWTRFLLTYMRAILESLKIHVDDESVNDSIIVFEFSNRYNY